MLSPADKDDFKDEQYPFSYHVVDCARKDRESPVRYCPPSHPTPLSFGTYQARVPVVKTMGVVSGVRMGVRQA
jgi:hypothetical protein